MVIIESFINLQFLQDSMAVTLLHVEAIWNFRTTLKMRLSGPLAPKHRPLLLELRENQDSKI